MLSLNVLSIDSASICLISDMLKKRPKWYESRNFECIWRIAAMSLDGNSECLYYAGAGTLVPHHDKQLYAIR